MILNKSKEYHFPQEFAFSNGESSECIEDTKLLGIILNSSLRWDSNTANMVTRAMSKSWLLQLLNLEPQLIFEYYTKEVRPLVEQGVVDWNSGLTRHKKAILSNYRKWP